MVKELNLETFEAETANGIVLVDFWAPWCGPCKVMLPILEELAAAVGDEATIAKVNVDDVPQLAASYSISSIPALLIFKDGELVDRMSGVHTSSQLLKRLGTPVPA